MSSSLSNLANNLSEGVHRIKCKFGHFIVAKRCKYMNRFYSHLDMGYISYVDYSHSKRVFKDFEIKFLENIMICIFKLMHYC